MDIKVGDIVSYTANGPKWRVRDIGRDGLIDLDLIDYTIRPTARLGVDPAKVIKR